MEIYSVSLEIPFARGEQHVIHLIPSGSFERFYNGTMRDEEGDRLLQDLRYCMYQFLHHRDQNGVRLTLRGKDPKRFIRFFPRHVSSSNIDASDKRAFGSMPVKRFPGQLIDNGFEYYHSGRPALIRYAHADILLQWDECYPQVDIQYRGQHSH